MLPIAKVAVAIGVATAGFFGIKHYVKPKASVMTSPTTGKPLLQMLKIPHIFGGTATVAVPVVSTSAILPHPPAMIVTPQGSGYVVSDDVRGVQGQLNVLGYGPLVVDGKAGPATSAAVTKFQSANGLTATGAIDSILHGKLSQMMTSASGNAGVGSSPAVVTATVTTVQAINTPKDVQHALNMLGASPPLVEDGNIGPKSIAAIKGFQLSHGLMADGIAGPQTKAGLGVALSQATPAAGEFGHEFRKAGPKIENTTDFYSSGGGIRG